MEGEWNERKEQTSASEQVAEKEMKDIQGEKCILKDTPLKVKENQEKRE